MQVAGAGTVNNKLSETPRESVDFFLFSRVSPAIETQMVRCSQLSSRIEKLKIERHEKKKTTQ
jgi:hypothetical protein